MNENPEAERLADALQRGIALVDRLRRERDRADAERDRADAERDRAIAERDRAIAERDHMMSRLITDQGESAISAGLHRYVVTCPVRNGFVEARFRQTWVEAVAAFREAWGLDAIGDGAGMAATRIDAASVAEDVGHG